MSKSSTKSSNSSTSSSNSLTNSTTTPTVAPWLANSYQGLNDLIGKFAQADPNSFVAKGNQALTTGINNATNLGGWQDIVKNAVSQLGGYGNQQAPQAAQATPVNTAMSAGQTPAETAFWSAPTATATSILGLDRSKYENPYTNQVVDTTLNDYDVNAGRTQAAQAAQAAQNRAFGGSRYGVREAQTEGELARGRAAAEANLRDQGFQQATASMQADAERAHQTAMMNAQMQMQAASQNAGAKNSMNQFYAGLGQNNNQFNAGNMNNTNQFNAAQTNAMNQFNTGLQDSMLGHGLTAAQAMGNFGTSLGAGQRDDIASQLNAGTTQYNMDQAKAAALPTWLQQLSGLYGSIPIGSFTSLNQSGTASGNQTGNSTGKSTTTGMSVGFNPVTGFSFGG